MAVQLHQSHLPPLLRRAARARCRLQGLTRDSPDHVVGVTHVSSCSLHDLDSRGRMVAAIVAVMTSNRLHLRLASAVNPHHTRLKEGYDLNRRSLPRENAIRRRFIGVGCSSRPIERMTSAHSDQNATFRQINELLMHSVECFASFVRGAKKTN